MLTSEQEKNLINSIPQDSAGEDRRAAYSVIAGVKEDKTPKQIAAYYSVNHDLVLKWYNFFNIEQGEVKQKGRRGRKGNDLTAFVKSNIGRVITPKQVAEEIGISLPTFYNYYNANRHFFKKVKRGEFEIITPER